MGCFLVYSAWHIPDKNTVRRFSVLGSRLSVKCGVQAPDGTWLHGMLSVCGVLFGNIRITYLCSMLSSFDQRYSNSRPSDSAFELGLHAFLNDTSIFAEMSCLCFTIMFSS